MSAPGDAAAQKRASWRSYFERQLTGGDAEVNAATEAAMRALERGADVNGIIAAGLDGARVFRTHGMFPAPAPADGPPVPAPRDRAEPARPAGVAQGQGYQAGRGPAAAAPAGTFQASGGGPATRGVVSGLQQRQEMFGRTYFTVWNFRLERRDAAGNPMTPIPVEMRGRRFTGGISNGDVVDIRQLPAPGKMAAARRVHNETVGADVRAIGKRHPVLRAFFVVVVLAGFATWVAFVMNVGG